MTDGPLKDLAELSIRELCEEREAAQLELENARADLELTRSEKVAALATLTEVSKIVAEATAHEVRCQEGEDPKAILYACAVGFRRIRTSLAFSPDASTTETKR